MMSIATRALVLMFVLASSMTACSKKDEKEKQASGSATDKPVVKPDVKPDDKPDVPPDEPEAKGGCSYITEAEASEALGQPSKYRSNDGSDNCLIDPVAEATQVTTSVDFTVKKGTTDGFDYLAKSKDAKPLEGLGDKAVWSGPDGMIIEVAVVKGGDEITMTATGGKAKDPAVIKAFVEKILGRL